MDGENHRGHESGRNLEPQQQPPEQQRAAEMQQKIIHVISQRARGPEVILDPEGGVRQGIILRLGFERLEPDSLQTGRGAELKVLLDIAIVVPDEAVFQDGKIGRNRHDNYDPDLPQLPEDGLVRLCDHGEG